MNVKLLRRIQKHILAEPRGFAMKAWIQRKYEFATRPNEVVDDYGKQHPFPPCNMAACIAGWAALLAYPRKTSINSWEVSLLAEAALGMNVYESPLFFTAKWPTKFNAAYRKAKTPLMRARIAVRRIDHFIATKGAE